jgi:hypothetical protein
MTGGHLSEVKVWLCYNVAPKQPSHISTLDRLDGRATRRLTLSPLNQIYTDFFE